MELGIVLRVNNGIWRVVEADDGTGLMTLKLFEEPKEVVHEPEEE